MEDPSLGFNSHVTVAVRVRGLEGEGEDQVPAIFPNEEDPGRSLIIDGGACRGAIAFTFDHAFWSLGQSTRCVW